MASADLKLIANAMVSGGPMVTREQPAPDSGQKIKMPDVCNLADRQLVDVSPILQRLQCGSLRTTARGGSCSGRASPMRLRRLTDAPTAAALQI